MLILFTSYPVCTWKILSKMLFILTPLITIDMFLHWQSHVVVTRSKIITIPQNFNYLNKYKRPVLMMSIMIKRMVFLVILVGVRNVHISLLLILLYLRLISKLFRSRRCFRNRPISNKNCLCRPCLLRDQD